MTGFHVRCLCFVTLFIGVSAGSSAATIYTFITIDVPGAVSTVAGGINDAGQIAGFFSDATGRHGFVKDGASFTTIDVPGAIDTSPHGINDAGQIVGTFFGVDRGMGAVRPKSAGQPAGLRSSARAAPSAYQGNALYGGTVPPSSEE